MRPSAPPPPRRPQPAVDAPGLDPFVQGVGAAWALEVAAALALSDVSAAAGTLPERLVTITMLASFGLVGVVGYAATCLPEGWPLLARRLLLLAGMAGTVWATGTLVRAVYALS